MDFRLFVSWASHNHTVMFIVLVPKFDVYTYFDINCYFDVNCGGPHVFVYVYFLMPKFADIALTSMKLVDS